MDRQWAAFVVALIVSKLVLIVVFLIAITQVATPIEADLASITEPISGIVLLFIAAFAPYLVYRFISFLGFDMYHAMGSEQDAKNAVNRPVPVPSKPQGDGVKKVLDGSGSGTPSAGSGSGRRLRQAQPLLRVRVAPRVRDPVPQRGVRELVRVPEPGQLPPGLPRLSSSALRL